MKLLILELPKLALQRRASAVLGLIIVAMLWAAVFIAYRSDVQEDYRDVQRRNQNYSLMFEENVLRSIGEIDKSLLYLRRTVEAAKDKTDYQTIVNSTDVLSEIIVQMAVIDAQGIAQGSNAKPPPTQKIDISDREHFRVHVNNPNDHVFISKPLIGRASGKWSVQFTRRFSNRDGSFAGVVVASMDPAHFTSFYDKIDLGATTSVAMVGSDGVVRSAGGGTIARLALGQNIAGTSLFEQLQKGSTESFEDSGILSDHTLLVTARQVRGYPLWVMVSTREADIYASAASNLVRNTIVVFFLTLLTLFALEQILRAEARAALKAGQLQLTLEHISQGIMLVTNDRQIPIINQRCAELLQLPQGMIDTPPKFDDLVQYEAKFGSVPLSDASQLALSDEEGGSHEPSMSDYQRTDGVFIEVRKSHLPDGSFVQTFSDITRRRQAEAYIARLASEDPLTKLDNRRVFRSKLQALCESEQRDFAVLFMDMDRFKVVNDTIGHRIGDNLLVAVAQRLRTAVRPEDVIARLGGDEFAVLLPAGEARESVERTAREIVAAMARPFQIDNHLISTSVSIGIAMGPQDGNSEDDLLVAADLALYAVKTAGRGSFRFYEKQMNNEVNEKRAVELDLREALEHRHLELYYQPIIDVKGNAIQGFEALARWPHPTKGMIPPGKFIAVAEDCGLIVPLGEWALMEACRRATTWPSNLKVSVNVSPMQLAGSDLPATVRRVLEATGLEPDRLALEFTERIFIDESDKTLAILHDLKALGVRIALDDFGTGYSSLSYLRSFPFDTLKIDRSFISDLGVSTTSNVIVQAVILIAGGLGIRTVAEGIETGMQLEMLKALGCEAVQGYHFSEPVPSAGASALIRKWSVRGVEAA